MAMDAKGQAELLSRIVEKNKHLEGLMANPDFVRWKEEVVEAKLDSIRDAVMSSDRSDPGWKEKALAGIVAYQESLSVYDGVFKLAEIQGRSARDRLAELPKGS